MQTTQPALLVMFQPLHHRTVPVLLSRKTLSSPLPLKNMELTKLILPNRCPLMTNNYLFHLVLANRLVRFHEILTRTDVVFRSHFILRSIKLVSGFSGQLCLILRQMTPSIAMPAGCSQSTETRRLCRDFETGDTCPGPSRKFIRSHPVLRGSGTVASQQNSVGRHGSSCKKGSKLLEAGCRQTD